MLMPEILKKHKAVVAFIVLLLLLGVFVAATLYSSILSYMEVSSSQADLKVSGMVETLNRVQERIDALEEEFHGKTENTMEMMCTALRSFAEGSEYTGPEVFEDGVVVRIGKDGGIVYPESFSGKFEILNNAGDLENLPVMTSTTLLDGPELTRPVLISAKAVTDGIYYIDWWEIDDYQSSINYTKYIGEAITTLERLYNAGLLLIEETDEGPSLLFASKKLGTPETIEDIGLKKEDISSESANLTISRKTYSASYEELRAFDRSAKAVILLDPINNDGYILNCLFIAGGFILFCMTAMILWIHWIEIYVKDHDVTEAQQKSWRIAHLQKTAGAVGLNGALLLFVLLIGYQLLGSMSRISNSNQESLDILMARLENNSREIAAAKGEEENWGKYYARRIADIYSSIPEVVDPEFLKKVNELIGSEYIMIFDGKGKELLSSNGYVGFKLGDGVNTEEDFRYLLQGIDYIVSEPEEEKFSGKTLQMIGVSMDVGEKDAYGAVVLAIDPQVTWETTASKEVENYIRMLTHQENLSFIVSREKGSVVYASDPDISGKEPSEFGLDETNLVPISMETFEILGKKQYGAFNEDEQYRYYFMTDADYLWGDTIRFSVFSAVSYLLICMVTALIMLGPSRINRKEFIEDSERLKEKLKQKPTLTVDPEVLDTFLDTDRGDRSVREWWHDLTPEQKVGQLIRLSVTIILIIILAIMMDKDEFGSRSVIGFILNGNWKRGVNELSITAIILCLVSLLVFILFKDLLCRILSSMFHAKGKTIIGLFSSLLQYIAIITTIFFCLSYLGFDTSVLITSASILTLAISLGSKDLIADILAGVFIIFEGDFHVGDIVEVNGFKGKVIDIGVRSTKLKNSSNNIKIIDNQSVKNVLNMSKESSWIFVSLKVSSKQPLKEIEKMLDRELPKVGENVPMILNGPFYFGIDEIGYHWLKITVGAACYQSDINKLKPQLNQHLWDIFEKNGFEL